MRFDITWALSAQASTVLTRAVLLVLPAILGCESLFDPSLYLNSGGGDSGVGPGDGGGPLPALVDECDDPALWVVTSSYEEFEVNTRTLNSTVDMCADVATPGRDGFYAFDVVAGERWHFHVTPLNTPLEGEQNPVLYTMPAPCDPRSCVPLNVHDLCTSQRDEHFTWVAPRAGRWFIGLDDGNDVGGRYTSIAVKSVCGNSIVEHNEGCDDGNLDPDDGCSPACRVDVPHGVSSVETEPNDDWQIANEVPFLPEDQGRRKIRGSIGGFCGADTYAVMVPEGGSLEVTIATGAAATWTCTTVPDNVAIPRLRLLGVNGIDVLGVGSPPTADNGCAHIGRIDLWARELPAGIYFVELDAQQDKDAFSYEVEIVLSD